MVRELSFYIGTWACLVKASLAKTHIFLQVRENTEVGKIVHYSIFNYSMVLSELHSRS